MDFDQKIYIVKPTSMHNKSKDVPFTQDWKAKCKQKNADFNPNINLKGYISHKWNVLYPLPCILAQS